MKKAGIGAKTYLVFLLVLMYLPIGVVVLFSFNASTARTPTVFTGFSLQWYEALFDGQRGFGEALKNSLVIAGCSVGLSTVLGTLGALGQVRRTARRRLAAAAQGVMESLTILPIMLPEIILGVAFMLLFSALGLRSGMLTLVLAHTTFCVPYVYPRRWRCAR